MANMLTEGAAFIAQQLIANASDPVVYTRGATSRTFNAVIGATPFEQTSTDGVVIRYESKDFILVAATLIAVFGLPRDGDRITHNGVTYETLPLDNEQPFRFSDRARTLIRVHTKEV